MSATAAAYNFAERRLDHLQRQYRRAHYVLSAALAAYEYLCAIPGGGDIQRELAWRRVKNARDLITAIQSAIEYVQDYESVYGNRLRIAREVRF